MNLDLTGLLILIAGLIGGGQPDRVEWAASVGVTIAYGSGGASSAIVIGVDPVAIRYQPAPWPWPWGDACGVSDGYNVWVDPSDGCTDTLDHELVHVEQRRALGIIGVGVLRAAGVDMEATPPWTASNMREPQGLNYPLLRITIPLRLERTP